MVSLSEPIDAYKHGLLIMSKPVHDNKHVTTIQKTSLSMTNDNANSTFTILYHYLWFLYSETLIKICNLRGSWKRWPLAYLKRERSGF